MHFEMILLVNESTKIIEHLFTTKMYGQEITPKPGKASDFNALFGLFSIFVLASFHFPLYAREYRSTPKYATDPDQTACYMPSEWSLHWSHMEANM